MRDDDQHHVFIVITTGTIWRGDGTPGLGLHGNTAQCIPAGVYVVRA